LHKLWNDLFCSHIFTKKCLSRCINVILVDFRGIDTMFETVVLAIAALGVYSLIKLRLKTSEKE